MVAWLAARFPKWPAIDAALSREGWKLVTLLRLSPLVPWNVLNYALSVTGDSLLSVTQKNVQIRGISPAAERR